MYSRTMAGPEQKMHTSSPSSTSFRWAAQWTLAPAMDSRVPLRARTTYLLLLFCFSLSVAGHRHQDPQTLIAPGSSLLQLGDGGTHGNHVYARLGDLNIGAIFSIHRSENKTCGPQLRESGVVQYVEALAFAIEQINNSTELLPGINLGFVVLDDCMSSLLALAQTLHFFPADHRPNAFCDRQCIEEWNVKKNSQYNGVSETSPHRFYDVVGVVGAENSPTSMVMANVLNIFQIPQISHASTSDLLSDKSKYPYFVRMMPPDRLQVQAILDLLLHFNWTYVSMVYSTGGYGEEAVKRLQVLASQNGICIGTTQAAAEQASDMEFDHLVEELDAHNARIVVLFVDQEAARGVFRATKKLGKIGQFVWIGSDGIAVNIDDFDGIEEAAVGTLTLRPFSEKAHEFVRYFASLSPITHTANPWFRLMWENLFECTWEEDPKKTTTAKRCSGNEQLHESADFTHETLVGNIIDSVYTFAHALEALINGHCRGVPARLLVDCVKGPLLLQYLREINFIGMTGNVSFDENGDILGRYEILNFQNYSGTKGSSIVPVGIWDISTRRLTLNDSHVLWAVPPGQEWSNGSVPVSSGCGQRCGRGEIHSYKKNTCCWNCLPCAPNEIPDEEATQCIKCKFLHWPSADLARCERLMPVYLHWHEPLALVLVGLALLGLVFSTLVLVIFARHNSARIIKATSRELSYIMLTGVLLQYILVLTFVSRPHAVVCVFNYIGFNLSFANVYAALLTRTNRIFRIFHAGKRTKVMPSFTSPISQVLISFTLIVVQVIITVLSTIFSPPKVVEHMPVLLEPHVELVCNFPVQGFVTSLSYNLLLVLICTVYAFKTRRLPDNFNESRCITLCVYTTLVIWLAFLPTYFTTGAYYQVILVSSALLLNATVTLLCLYAPRICALRSELLHGSGGGGGGGGSGGGGSANSANTFKYACHVTQNMLLRGRLETGPSQVDDQGTELSDYGGNFS